MALYCKQSNHSMLRPDYPTIIDFILKMTFFSESTMCFSYLQISKKNIPNHYPEPLYSSPMTVVNKKFKFQAQESNMEYIFLEIWRFEKRIALSE